MPDDLYAGIAARYDRFDDPGGQGDAAELTFYRQLFAAHDVRSVLDCACGTGRHLVLFHELGKEVVGSDISPSMLAQARGKLQARGLDIELHELDYRELPRQFRQRFHCVACLSSSILHMPSEDEVLRAFRSMRSVLREGGILVLTQGTTDKQWREKPRVVVMEESRDYTRLLVIDYLEQGARYNILDIDHSRSPATQEVWSVEYPRMYLRDDYARLLPAAGFGEVSFCGSYLGGPYDPETSDRLIIIAGR